MDVFVCGEAGEFQRHAGYGGEVLADQAGEEVVGSFHRFLAEAMVLAFDEQNGIERVCDGVLAVGGVDVGFVHV
ncbi:hypothetical protein [Streptomyces acidicola]|uniref:Uncharacterized protein n=1 Tax=Streptomyces acidicola TaxID=2596892 RepID=A0A5N8X3U3_9ACTN|nr:hypothetical protein [Streptomyces acidicola]MPY53674.1 hypothetical protein [Streptomyces acidicola]